MTYRNFLLKVVLGASAALVGPGALAAPACSNMFMKASAESLHSDILRMQELLEQTPEGSPVRTRIETQLENAQRQLAAITPESSLGETQRQQFNNNLGEKLAQVQKFKNKQDPRNADAIHMFESKIVIEVSGGLPLEISLFQLNSLSKILEALKVIDNRPVDEGVLEVKKTALFELAQRLNPAHHRGFEIDQATFDGLSQILYFSAKNIYNTFETPQGSLPGLNPFRYIDVPLLTGSFKIPAQAELQLVAALIAGTTKQDLLRFDKYYGQFVGKYVKSRSGFFGLKKSTTSYDQEIRETIQDLAKSSEIYRKLAEKL